MFKKIAMKTLIGGKKYPEGKEHFLIGSVLIGATKRKPKNLAFKTPHVKVRVSRGKDYDFNKRTTGPDDTVRAFRQYLNKNNIEGQEQFLIMYLTRSNSIIGIYPHSKGTMTATTVDIKLITATAVQLAAEAIITCHNHPSGNLQPSDADKQLASRLGEACKILDIGLLDNIILTKNNYNRY